MKWLHNKKGYKPEMLKEEEPMAAIRETFRILQGGVNSSITQETPPELTAALTENVFVFSGFKEHHELVEASRLLTDQNGDIKPFNRYLNDVRTLHEEYNKNYLRAEYNFAVRNSQMAVKWKEWEETGDRYLLQYRTAGDDRVRETHAVLDGTTLPMDDPFWDKYLPPLGWNCRCTTVQVRRGKYPESDSKEAVMKGENCTASVKQQIFRFNPGKVMKVFPPKHPYLPKGCGECDIKNLAYDKDSGQCKVCQALLNQNRIVSNKKEYERLKKDPDYMDVRFNKKNGGLKASHIGHNFDKIGGVYEKHVQNAGFISGHKVIFGNEKNGGSKERFTEGTWDNKQFEVAGRETATENNILKGLKHCASKRTTQIAVLDFPNGKFSQEIIKEALKRFNGLEKLKDGQYLKFEKIICVQNETIVFEIDL